MATINNESDLVNAFANQNQPEVYSKVSPTPAAGIYVSMFAAAGLPGAGSLAVGNTTTGVIPTSATAGALALNNASTGSLYLGQANLLASGIGVLTIYDRLWHGGSYTSVAGAISANTTTAISRYTTGENTELWVEIASATSALATTITVTYTSSTGATGRTATCTIPASAIASRMLPFTLQAGDYGVRQITNISGSAAPTGTFNIIIMKRLADIPISVANTGTSLNWLDLGLPKLEPSPCITALWLNQAGTTAISMAGKFSVIG